MTIQIPRGKADTLTLDDGQLTDILASIRADHKELNIVLDRDAGGVVVDYEGNEVLRGLQKSAHGTWICRTLKGFLTPIEG